MPDFASSATQLARPRFGRRPTLFRRALSAIGLSLAIVPPAAAQGTGNLWARAGTQGDYVVRDFRFTTGEVLPELKLHYTTLGTPRKDARGIVRNAVMILHGTGGSGRSFLSGGYAGQLFGPGQTLDTTKFYVVLPDGIGHGGSSKPSDGPSMNSIARYTTPSGVSPKSKIDAMFGCESWLAFSASRVKRCNASTSPTSPGRMILIALLRFMRTCSARYTWPMPPSPMRDTMR